MKMKHYFALTKPGIIFGNVLSAIAGALMAGHGRVDLSLLLSMCLGLALVIASACVFNNCLDRDIDAKMQRTENRAFVKGHISLRKGCLFATLLLIFGSLILAATTNTYALISALIGFFGYVIVYTLSKRKTTYGTLLGSIAGAMPPVVGYTAVSNALDSGAFIVFAIIALWQMPHFYAIALYRLDDYKAADIPVLPAVRGVFRTKVHMVLYAALFFVAALLPFFFGYTGVFYLVSMSLISLIWLGLCLLGLWKKETVSWARQVFFFSLVVIIVFVIALL